MSPTTEFLFAVLRELLTGKVANLQQLWRFRFKGLSIDDPSLSSQRKLIEGYFYPSGEIATHKVAKKLLASGVPLSKDQRQHAFRFLVFNVREFWIWFFPVLAILTSRAKSRGTINLSEEIFSRESSIPDVVQQSLFVHALSEHFSSEAKNKFTSSDFLDKTGHLCQILNLVDLTEMWLEYWVNCKNPELEGKKFKDRPEFFFNPDQETIQAKFCSWGIAPLGTKGPRRLTHRLVMNSEEAMSFVTALRNECNLTTGRILFVNSKLPKQLLSDLLVSGYFKATYFDASRINGEFNLPRLFCTSLDLLDLSISRRDIDERIVRIEGSDIFSSESFDSMINSLGSAAGTKRKNKSLTKEIPVAPEVAMTEGDNDNGDYTLTKTLTLTASEQEALLKVVLLGQDPTTTCESIFLEELKGVGILTNDNTVVWERLNSCDFRKVNKGNIWSRLSRCEPKKTQLIGIFRLYECFSKSTKEKEGTPVNQQFKVQITRHEAERLLSLKNQSPVSPTLVKWIFEQDTAFLTILQRYGYVLEDLSVNEDRFTATTFVVSKNDIVMDGDDRFQELNPPVQSKYSWFTNLEREIAKARSKDSPTKLEGVSAEAKKLPTSAVTDTPKKIKLSAPVTPRISLRMTLKEAEAIYQVASANIVSRQELTAALGERLLRHLEQSGYVSKESPNITWNEVQLNETSFEILVYGVRLSLRTYANSKVSALPTYRIWKDRFADALKRAREHVQVRRIISLKYHAFISRQDAQALQHLFEQDPILMEELQEQISQELFQELIRLKVLLENNTVFWGFGLVQTKFIIDAEKTSIEEIPEENWEQVPDNFWITHLQEQLAAPPVRVNPTLNDLAAAIYERSKISLDEIRDTRRAFPLPLTREILCYIAYYDLAASVDEIATFIARTPEQVTNLIEDATKQLAYTGCNREVALHELREKLGL